MMGENSEGGIRRQLGNSENTQEFHGASPSAIAAFAPFPQNTRVICSSNKTLPLVHMQSMSRWEPPWRLKYDVHSFIPYMVIPSLLAGWVLKLGLSFVLLQLPASRF